MIQNLFDTYVFLYIIGGFSFVGIMIKLCLYASYRSFIKNSENVSTCKKRWLKQMKLKFETCYQLKIGVNNVDVFVDKYVSKRKFCGILLSTWENISGQMVALCLLTASCAGILGIVYECGKDIVLFTFLMGAAGSILVAIVDNFANISAHKEILFLNLKDYFENYLKVRLEREHFRPEEFAEYQKEYINSVAESNLQMASSKENLKESKSIGKVIIHDTEKKDESRGSKKQKESISEEASEKLTEKKDKKSARLAAKKEKKEAKFAEKKEKKDTRIAKKEIALARKLEKKNEKKFKKYERKEAKAAAKLAAKMEKKNAVIAKQEAAMKARQEMLNEKIQKKLDNSAVKEERQKLQDEQAMTKSRAYQLKMQLKEEKELEYKKYQEEKNAMKDRLKAEDSASEQAINKASEPVTEAAKPNVRKTEEDKLIEEVLREFLA